MKHFKHLFVFALLLTGFSYAQEKLTATDVIARSLAAIGTPESRAQLQYHELSGKAKMHTSVRSTTADGTALLLSEKGKMKFKMKFDSKVYSGDQFAFDGNQVQVSRDNQGVRSAFGAFLYQQSRIVSEGLPGGVLSKAWPLYDPKLNDAKVQYDGLKKVDGVKLHQLTYVPKKGDDHLTIHIYFDESFRHVKTTYELMVQEKMGTAARSTSPQTSLNSYLLEENFSGFLNIAGMTLPTRHSFSYQATNSELGQWSFEMTYDDLNGTKLPAVGE